MRPFGAFALKVVVVHTLTYFAYGLILSHVFDYGRLFQQEVIRDFMRPIDSPYVYAGPLLQPIRGLLFAIAIWPLRAVILASRHGWLILWNILVMVGILSTPAAAPCSVEGVIYSKLPLWYHLIGLPEILLQTLTFSVLLMWWWRRSEATSQARVARPPGLPAELVKAAMTACFGYIGYAIGGLLSVALVRTAGGGEPDADIDIEAAASNLTIQMMFVAAFLVNTIAVFVIGRRHQAGRFPLLAVFAVFWAVDTAVPWLYQALLLSPSPAHLALLLGFFPAAIICLTMRMSYGPTERPKP
ncbi:MAG TPA: hypothetical protein VFM88_19630 [Vicinamibacteria bacterium]|nr:hypothetical protein [Vicinamibacteria bacterium]